VQCNIQDTDIIEYYFTEYLFHGLHGLLWGVNETVLYFLLFSSDLEKNFSAGDIYKNLLSHSKSCESRYSESRTLLAVLNEF
jgi:hypothetical protein